MAPSTPSDMLHYYHECLLEYLKKVKSYKSVRRSERTGETLTTTEKVGSALVKLKASANAVLDAVPAQDSSITLDMIDTLHHDLATAKAEWTRQAGEAKMHAGSNDDLKFVYGPAPGEDNMVIYEVTKLIADCLTYLENIKAEFPEARASALVAPAAGAASTKPIDMHALLSALSKYSK